MKSNVFSADWYLKSYPDVVASGMPPLLHYQKFGKKEGRLPCANAAYDLEISLWEGCLSALPILQNMNVENASSYEVAYAHWALARWHASNDEWSLARPYIQKLIQHPVEEGVPSHAGPALLACSVLLHCGELALAAEVLQKSISALGMNADFQLARFNLAQSTNLHAALKSDNGLVSLNEIYSEQQLDLLSAVNAKNKLGIDNIQSGELSGKISSGPLVSIIMPCFNAEKALATALRSLLKQSWVNIEVLLVDDCSTDNSLAIAHEFEKNDRRVKVLSHHVNQGAYAARNTGLKYARGDYITVHDADDYSHGQKIQLQIEPLLSDPKLKASVSHWVRCTDELIFGTWRQDVSWIHRNVSSLMFTRGVFEALGYWDRVSVNADTEFYYRLLHAYGNHAITEVLPGIPLAFGRMDSNSLTQNPITHLRTQFKGVRKDYMDSAHKWHKASISTSANDLYVEFNPEVRLFDAPALIERKGCYFGINSRPYLPGLQSVDGHAKCILLCAHMVGKSLFGAERSFIDLAKAINELGYRLVIALPSKPTEHYKQILLQCCTAIVITPYHWWREDKSDSDFVIELFEDIMRSFSVDLVHANTLVLNEPHLAAKKLNIPSLMHVRELPDFDFDLCGLLRSNPEAIRRYMHKVASGFIANSECTSRYINDGARTDVLYNTVEAEEFFVERSDYSVSSKVNFALISSNVPKKGVMTFIKLAEMSLTEVPDAHFSLIGPISDFIDGLNADELPKNLTVCGYAESPQLALKDVDVVLSVSDFQESFGRTVAEAMSAEIPVIAYRWGAIPEIIDNGINGYLVHHGDLDGLLLRVKILTEDTGFRHKLGRSAKQKIITDFNFKDFSNQLNEIYGKYINA